MEIFQIFLNLDLRDISKLKLCGRYNKFWFELGSSSKDFHSFGPWSNWMEFRRMGLLRGLFGVMSNCQILASEKCGAVETNLRVLIRSVLWTDKSNCNIWWGDFLIFSFVLMTSPSLIPAGVSELVPPRLLTFALLSASHCVPHNYHLDKETIHWLSRNHSILVHISDGQK